MNQKEKGQATKATSEEIIRLAKGSPEEKRKAAILIREGETQDLSREALEIAKRLAMSDQPEEVRLELAKTGDMIMDLRIAVNQVLTQDPSEIVREQLRIYDEQGIPSLTEFAGAEPSRVGILSRLIRCRSRLKSYLLEQRLTVFASLGVILGVAVALVLIGVRLEQSSLDSLVQTNATIFALVFTIPLAAAQFSRYPISTESIFDTRAIAFFSLYVLSVFLPLILYDTSFSPLFVGLSVTCVVLVFPFLFRVARSLGPADIVRRAELRTRKRWRRREFQPPVELEYLAYKALSMRDYDTYSQAVSSLANLIPAWGETPARKSYDPLQLDVAGLQATLRRVGVTSIRDPNALKAFCYRLLSIHIYEEDTLQSYDLTKQSEFGLLKALTENAGQSSDALGTALSYLIVWCIQNSYASKKDEKLVIQSCAVLLLHYAMPSPVQVLDNFRRQIVSSPRVISLSETYPLRIWTKEKRQATRRILSALELEIDELGMARKGPLDKRVVTVLPSDEKDAEAILQLQRIAFAQEAAAYDDYFILPLNETSEDIVKEFRYKHFLKAMVADVLIGCIRGEYRKPVCRITRLMVHPKYTGLGIEERLIARMERIFPEAGRLEAIAYDRSAVLTVYQKVGYQTVRKEQLSNTIAMTCLEKTVGPRHKPKRRAGET